MNYTEKDLPVTIKHGETVTLPDNVTVRFESNGEAKDVFLGDEWAPSLQLFPACDHTIDCGAAKFKLTAEFSDALKVEKL